MNVFVSAKLKKYKVIKNILSSIIYNLITTNIPVYTWFPQAVNSLGSLESMSSF